jgi:K+-sensing histidine kinase KdpD
VVTALAFDVLLTRPYYSFAVDAADDVEAALVLGLLALVVATIVTREIEARGRSSSRRRELAAIDSVAHALAHGDSERLTEV